MQHPALCIPYVQYGSRAKAAEAVGAVTALYVSWRCGFAGLIMMCVGSTGAAFLLQQPALDMVRHAACRVNMQCCQHHAVVLCTCCRDCLTKLEAQQPQPTVADSAVASHCMHPVAA